MKKKLQFLSSLVVMLCMSIFANAQKDVTATYLTNADLSTVDNGWTYYSDAFKYTDWKTDGDVPVVEFYSQWNAGASQSIAQKDFKFSQKVTLPAGVYRIVVNAFYRNGAGDGTNENKAWIFAGKQKKNVEALTEAGVADYTGSNDLYKAANAFSKGDFSNSFEFTVAKEQEVELGFQGFFNTSLSWCILGPVKLYLVKAIEIKSWYDASKFTAKDYEGFTEVVSDEQWSPGSWQPAPQYYKDGTTVKMVKTQPEVAAARYDADGDYIEVKSNDMPVSDYDCQFWMQIPEELRANGTKIEVSMQAWADADITVQPQIHAAPSAWKDNSNPKATFVAGKWTDIKYCFTINKDGVENYCFNLSDQGTEKARTYRFRNIEFVAGKADWYYTTEFHAKDYKDPSASYSDSDNPHPAARYVADDEVGYIEVISNAGATQTYNSQLWIQIPEQYVGKSTKMTMEVQASKAIKTPESFQATATGNGWGCNPGPGSGVEFKVGEWTTITRILNTKDVKSTGTWKDRQADQYCLDLSEASGDKEAITYKFRNVKFDKAQEAWYTDIEIIAKDYKKGDETYTNSDTEKFPAARYVYDDKGDYVEVVSNANRADEWDSQIWIEIPSSWVGKKVKMTMDVQASKEVSAAAAYHSFPGGNHWGPGAGDAVPFKVGEWTSIERILNTKDVKCNKGEQVKYYVLNLSNDEKGAGTGITYQFKDIAWSEAPVTAWEDVIPLQDFEAGYTGAADEPIYFLSKENVIAEGDTHRARIVEGAGKDSSKGIEFRTQGGSANWDSQFEIRFPYQLPNGTKYKLEFDYKCDATGNFGTQSWDGAVGSYATGGTAAMSISADEVGTWKHYSQEYTVNYTRKDGDGNVTNEGLRWDVFDLAQSGQPKAILFIDNISVQVPEGTLPFKDAEGKEIAPDYLSATEYPIYEYVDPATLDWSDNILENGDLSTDDMDEFVLKNNDVEDPEMLPAERTEIGGAYEIDIETAARPTDGDGNMGGNDHDAQFFVRLPYVLPKGKKFNLEFDLYAEHLNTLAIQAHAEPGQYKGNLSSVKTDTSGEGIVHYQEYLTAPENMRTIAFNLAVADATTYGFSNIKVQIVKDDEADIKAATEAADATSLWAETLALNIACNEARNTETEGKGYDEALVKDLDDAFAAGKAELKKKEEEVTKESLAAATKAIEDAIAALKAAAPEEFLDMPELDDSYIEIAQTPAVGFDNAESEKGEYKGVEYTSYTASGMSVAFKMTDIDVTGCDKIYVYFAQPVKAGWKKAFWGIEGPDGCVDIEAGTEMIEFDLTEKLGDTSAIKEEDGKTILKEAVLIYLWGAEVPLNAKVYGVYKHKVGEADAINEVAEDAALKDGKYFIDGQIVIVKNGVKYNAAGVAIQ
jgi:hypothetical protein